MCPIRGASYSVLSTCVPLLPYGSDPHPLIIKGHLSLLSSLSLGTMPNTCHFCHAQELPSAQRLLGSPELEHSQNLFLYGGCRSGRPEWNSHVSFPSGPTGWRVGKKNTGGSHQAAAYDQRDTFPSTLGFPRGEKNSCSLIF